MACIFIGQLPFSKFFDADLYDLLEPFGHVVSVRMQHKKGEAFVTFESANGADAAIATLHGQRTLKGRHRPLQLFYASSSSKWSWFGILHNTRLHHLNPKVELPPFFSRKPPLEESQWTLMPNITAEATELVLPATLAAAAAEKARLEEARRNEQQTSSSSLRTTTSSSPLFSHTTTSAEVSVPVSETRASSGGSSSHDSSAPTTVSTTSSLTSASSTASQNNINNNQTAAAAEEETAEPLAGTKRTRLHPSPSTSDKDTHKLSGAAKARKLSSLVTADAAQVSNATDTPTATHRHAAESKKEVAAREDDEEATATRISATEAEASSHNRPPPRTHRKTKLRIEEGEERAERSTTASVPLPPPLTFLPPPAPPTTTTAAAVAAGGGGAMPASFGPHVIAALENQLLNYSSCSSGGATAGLTGGGGSSSIRQSSTDPDTAQTSATVFADLIPLPVLLSVPPQSNANVSSTEMPQILEHSSTTITATTTPATSITAGHAFADTDDAVGTRNVVIRRRRATTTAVSAENSASIISRPDSAPAPLPPRPVRSGVLPHHFHHASHGSTSLSSHLTGSSTSTTTTSHDSSKMATSTPGTAEELQHQLPQRDGTASVAASARRVTSPHHHHHYHQHHRQQGAVLPDDTTMPPHAAVGHLAPVEASVLGASAASFAPSPSGSWSASAGPVLASPTEREASFAPMTATRSGVTASNVDFNSWAVYRHQSLSSQVSGGNVESGEEAVPLSTEIDFPSPAGVRGYARRRGGRGYRRQ